MTRKQLKLKEAKKIGQGVGLIISGALIFIFSLFSLLSGNFFAQFTLIFGIALNVIGWKL